MFEEEPGAGDIGTFLPSLTRAMRKGKLLNATVLTWSKTQSLALGKELLSVLLQFHPTFFFVCFSRWPIRSRTIVPSGGPGSSVGHTC